MELVAMYCKPGDRFWARGKNWRHCGCRSVVNNVCAQADDGQRLTFPAHETVDRFYEGTAADASDATAHLSRPAIVW